MFYFAGSEGGELGGGVGAGGGGLVFNENRGRGVSEEAGWGYTRREDVSREAGGALFSITSTAVTARACMLQVTLLGL